ncbi:type II glyceraldehyde-3-phosphate dehydrogenase [Fervidicoccus fontis]|uniref:Glyceraldehyde-3-phosphate dehydrogenase n=1 Tax=Fervidicoccus fontis TaxID=683846 RepID=A0A2J6N9M8_9CREN|nr:type II glyceraldehyde-3-phosphate dehydrogenase [Fervidicoccus fontis]PMB75366.1 MAG: type II glyceraldehyde-3-phosphate dehydrogenase [Fervidicoccus fontis]PMB75494.1 MAG: type II glyceraldehyde-3-phosphate dehydrogenase [Fervidicoccus fontis]PMB76258.1 MAG: type II glyceraldehyde-3-phosphate dehydrogenase [Fervidicoccus fontis]PMB78049.1 MAG: type II glyceraldehyde-3-phosphate dehydrogenase [Fervidicoccus fontis]HEW64230.1 type II glyceraldehyde-3-phosphate dehydrogenase [Fervidicoccus f
MKSFARVLVMGYGVIGKRVADAVVLQDDMKLVGVGDVSSDWRIKLAQKKGINVYAVGNDAKEKMEKSGIKVEDTVESLLKSGAVDIVVDATPKDIGARNKETLYKKYGVNAIFQGGEKAEIVDVSFIAQRNYREALGKKFIRVVSCNTTAIGRVIGGLHEKIGIKKARVSIIRRAVDVWESHSTGIMNTVVPESSIPSHHGPDVKTVVKNLNIVTMAFKGSHNLFHMHSGFIEFNRPISKDEVLNVLNAEPRVSLIAYKDGLMGLNSVFELSRDLNRPRGDLYEVPVWSDLMKVEDNELYLIWATGNESIVIPESIDAIRASLEIEEEPEKSIQKTDKTLNITKSLY